MLRNILWVLVLATLLLAGLAFASYGVFGGDKIDIISRETDTDNVSEPFSVVALGRVGVGQGGKWHFAPDLADSIVLIHFRPETGVVNLIRVSWGIIGNDRHRNK